MTYNCDPYLHQTIEAIGLTATIIALQQHAARTYRQYERCMANKHYGHFIDAMAFQETAAWGYRNARQLMGIE